MGKKSSYCYELLKGKLEAIKKKHWQDMVAKMKPKEESTPIPPQVQTHQPKMTRKQKIAAKRARVAARATRCYCFECLRKFWIRDLAADRLCPFCKVLTRANSNKVVASVVSRAMRMRGVIPPKPKEDYEIYLRSDLWKTIRDRVQDRDGRKCQACGAASEVVHHRSYAKEVMDGLCDERLISLCHSCHGRIEFETGKKGRRVKNGLKVANRKLDEMLRKCGTPLERSR